MLECLNHLDIEMFLPFSRHGVILAKRVSPCKNFDPEPENLFETEGYTPRIEGTKSFISTKGYSLPLESFNFGLIAANSPSFISFYLGTMKLCDEPADQENHFVLSDRVDD